MNRKWIWAITTVIMVIIAIIPSHISGAIAQNEEVFQGSSVVYAGEDGLYWISLDENKEVLIVKGSYISEPVFSKSGKIIVFKQERDLFAYDFTTSKITKILAEVSSYCAGAENEFYMAGKSIGIQRINLQTLTTIDILPYDAMKTYNNLKLSPDHRYLAFSVENYEENTHYSGGLWIYDTQTKIWKQIVEGTRNTDDSIGNNPRAAKWSPDSKKLFFWDIPGAASLAADGVGARFYDMEREEIILESSGLAYDENVSFSESHTFAMITGGSRMMFENKYLTVFDLNRELTRIDLETPGLIPTTPDYSKDGKILIFSASPSVEKYDDFAEKMASISKRQIYKYVEGKICPLTQGEEYRSEYPTLLRDQQHMVFARVSRAGEKSLWIMDINGKNMKQVARWQYSEPVNVRGLDFYGRIDWSSIFTVHDNTKSTDISQMQ